MNQTRDCVLFFVKYPEPGTVKTRLGEEVSPEMAAEFYATFVEEKFEELAADSPVDLIVCFAPATAGQAMRDWLGEEHQYLAQQGDDLGPRIENGFHDAFAMGYERVLLTGSDIPGFSAAIIEEGLAAITPQTASIGPADDGGYYCIGFHKDGFVPKVFHNILWSTETVFDDTANRLADHNMEYHELPHLEDTDTIEDVETLIALGQSGPLGPRSLAMARKLTNL